MGNTIKRIMLIDDNEDDNFIHSRAIKKYDKDIEIIIRIDGLKAINYFKDLRNEEDKPDIVFLDINMPIMNGWDFLDQYEKLPNEFKSNMLMVMLTTSDNPDDLNKATAKGLTSGFKNKPLTPEMLKQLIEEHNI